METTIETKFKDIAIGVQFTFVHFPNGGLNVKQANGRSARIDNPSKGYFTSGNSPIVVKATKVVVC